MPKLEKFRQVRVIARKKEFEKEQSKFRKMGDNTNLDEEDEDEDEDLMEDYEKGFYHNSNISDHEQLPASPKEINITEAYSNIKEGLSLKEFDSFKNKLNESLVKNKFGKNYNLIIEKINKSINIDELNNNIEILYNYADKNNIIIKS